MKAARIRLIVAAGLFVLWMGYLIHLAYTAHQQRAVLSAPQFLVSEDDVVAEVTDPKEPVKVVEVLYPEADKERLKGQSLRVENLADCRVAQPQTADAKEAPPPGEVPPGRYLLPLVNVHDGKAWVALIPPSPGFPPGKPLIYPDSENAREQALRMRKPAGR
ncbi:MAG TPA: hypothetical protein VFA26_03095 [Gemmataceae bacterium]|nr:hypothetical protein [Gemmataceae bacterium]